MDAGALGRFYGSVTEVVDALDAVGAALPREMAAEYRRRKTIQGKALYLWRNKRFINVGDAVANILVENLKDAIIGKANRYANELTKSPYWTSPRGTGISRYASGGIPRVIVR